MNQELPSVGDIQRHVASGDIKVTRDPFGILTGIYATRDVAKSFSPVDVHSAEILPTTRAESNYDLGTTVWQLFTSDFYLKYDGDALLEKAQTLPKKERIQGNHIFPPGY